MIELINAVIPTPLSDIIVGKPKQYSECTPEERREIHGVIPCHQCEQYPHMYHLERPDNRQSTKG